MKGATRNYSTRPNEKLHGPLKEAYERQSNGKEVTDQVCFDVMIPDMCCSCRDNCFHYNNRYCASINANMPSNC